MSNILARCYDDAVGVTPSDVTAQAATKAFAGLYVGVTGDVTLVTVRGNSVLFKAVPAGTELHVAWSWVKATGTTATQLLGLRAEPFTGVA